MCIDEPGNLYVAAGLHRTRRTSETLDTLLGIHAISLEDTITNSIFGGDDLRDLLVEHPHEDSRQGGFSPRSVESTAMATEFGR